LPTAGNNETVAQDIPFAPAGGRSADVDEAAAERGEVAAPRLAALTGLRAFAALWVMLHHFAYSPFGALHLRESVPALRFGYLGVDLFFMLSGFIIAHTHRRDAGSLVLRTVLRFYGRRLARLYPVHLLTLLALLVMLWVGHFFNVAAHRPETFRPVDFFYNLILMQAWAGGAHLSWNFPAWSISCEWFAYLAFPLLAFGLNRVTAAREAIAWLAMTLAAFILGYRLLFDFNLDQPLNGLALARIAFEFTLGALCCRVTELTNLRSQPWTVLVLASIAAAASLGDTPVRDLAITGVFGVIIVAGRYRDNLVARFLALPVIVYLGEISYSLYMVHAPLRMTLGKLAERSIDRLGASFEGWLAAAAFCLVTLVTAAAVYHLVEVPARRRLQRWRAERDLALPLDAPDGARVAASADAR
jgi:peptidoglycan/LPS O-acetylase OafA/YrhL